MNKTCTINLCGRVYHINEDAYNALNDYLNDLTQHFSQEEGSQEIMDDIESRIGELFTERMRFGMQVIGISDVEDVIAIMGHPEEIEEPTEGTTTPPESDTDSTRTDADASQSESKETETGNTDSSDAACAESKKTCKRLFRSPDDKVIAGVCGGLGCYFNVESWIFRLLFIFMFFAGFGSPILIYVVMWLVIPEAKNVAQKLQMRGEQPNVDNIRNAINDGEINTPTQKPGLLSEVLGFFVKLTAIITGGCLGMIALFILLGVGMNTFPMLMNHFGWFPFNGAFSYGNHYFTFVGNPLPMFIACLIAIILPIYALIQVLLVRSGKVKPVSKAAGWTIFGIWAIAVGYVIYAFL